MIDRTTRHASLLPLYYFLKPLIPRRLQLAMRRLRAHRILASETGTWPIDPSASPKPKGWPGWPGGKQFALALTHDVEGRKGLYRVRQVMDIETRLGFRSSFNFVGGDYDIPPGLLEDLKARKFEIAVHGLHHNGLMYCTRGTFERHALGIRRCLKDWNAVGFRSPAMHRNLEWIHELGIRYDSSTFDTDPFEPQPEGVRTIFPFWTVSQAATKAYVELPYTIPQDFTLFIMLREKSNAIWKRKLDWIAAQGGMALVIVHPDYLCFDSRTPGREEYPVQLYVDLLEYVRNKYAGQYWPALPNEIADYHASISPLDGKLMWDLGL